MIFFNRLLSLVLKSVCLLGLLINPSLAIENRSICYNLLRTVSGVEILVTSYQEQINLVPQYHQNTANLLQRTHRFINSNPGIRTDEFIDDFRYKNLNSYYTLLFHIFHNTAQHGSVELFKENPDLSKVIIDVDISSSLLNNGVKFKITNPQIKPFPRSLNKRFYAHDPVDDISAQRVGFKGRGVAHGRILNTLKDFPQGSYVEWSANDTEVTFTLFVVIN